MNFRDDPRSHALPAVVVNFIESVTEVMDALHARIIFLEGKFAITAGPPAPVLPEPVAPEPPAAPDPTPEPAPAEPAAAAPAA
jgi:hypothetical protein